VRTTQACRENRVKVVKRRGRKKKGIERSVVHLRASKKKLGQVKYPPDARERNETRPKKKHSWGEDWSRKKKWQESGLRQKGAWGTRFKTETPRLGEQKRTGGRRKKTGGGDGIGGKSV